MTDNGEVKIKRVQLLGVEGGWGMIRRRNLTSKKVGKYDRIRSDGTSWGRGAQTQQEKCPG